MISSENRYPLFRIMRQIARCNNRRLSFTLPVVSARL